MSLLSVPPGCQQQFAVRSDHLGICGWHGGRQHFHANFCGQVIWSFLCDHRLKIWENTPNRTFFAKNPSRPRHYFLTPKLCPRTNFWGGEQQNLPWNWKSITPSPRKYRGHVYPRRVRFCVCSIRHGRRPAVIFSVFLSGLVGCVSAFSPNIFVFIGLRFIQGISYSVGPQIPIILGERYLGWGDIDINISPLSLMLRRKVIKNQQFR